MSNISSVVKKLRAFILEGDIIDMAVGAIIGGAFNKTVTFLVNDILMPLLGVLTGDAGFSTFKYVIRPVVMVNGVEIAEVAVLYGNLLQNILDFLIIDAYMFFATKIAAVISSRLRHEEKAKEKASAPAGPTQEEFLAEARDLLKERGDVA